MKLQRDQIPQRAERWLSHQLATMPDPPTMSAAVCQLLPQLIDCDEVVWNGADVIYRWATMYDDGSDRYGPEVEQLLLDVTDNPVRRHYLSCSDAKGRPVRIGDISSDRQFRNTRAWAELYHPLGITRQLTIPTVLTTRRETDGTAISVTGGTAWSLNRAGTEFSDHDLAVAVALQPLLTTLEARDGAAPEHVSGATQQRSDSTRSPLTDRELEVLSLVARGLTATSVGHRLHISAGTVRKHLEHIYQKTGQRDRLLAVTYAQRTGLLPAR